MPLDSFGPARKEHRFLRRAADAVVDARVGQPRRRVQAALARSCSARLRVFDADFPRPSYRLLKSRWLLTLFEDDTLPFVLSVNRASRTTEGGAVACDCR